MTRDEILLFLRTNKQELSRVHGVIHIGLLGSYARQAACDSSDIDLMVELEDEKKP